MQKSNELGYTFKVQITLTKYVQEEQFNGGNVLPALDKNLVVLEIARHGVFQTFVLYDTKKESIVLDLEGFEQAACKLDAMKLNKKFYGYENAETDKP